MRLTGAQILWECLLREGVDMVFGYPGGAILPAYDAMLDYPGPPRAGAPRAGRRAHGRRLRPRQRQGRRLHRHPRPGRDQPDDRHRDRDDGLDPDRRHHRPGARARCIGNDAFQETDVTGITMPITKHNCLVTDVRRRSRATLREAFHIARAGRPGPVLVDICKDAQQAEDRLRLARRRSTCPATPSRRRRRASRPRARRRADRARPSGR